MWQRKSVLRLLLILTGIIQLAMSPNCDTCMAPRIVISMWPLKKNIERTYYFVTGLAQSVERLSSERDGVGSISGAGPIVMASIKRLDLRVAWMTTSKMAVPSGPVGDVKIVSTIGTLVLNTLTLE